MEERDPGITAIVQLYLDHLEAGGAPTPREFLVSRGLVHNDDLIEVLSLVAGPRGPGDRLGPYKLIRELGRGAQGTVYFAEDTRLGRHVALKTLAPNSAFGTTLGALLKDKETSAAARRFQREAESASRLDHPGICTVYEAGVENGIPFIAMRYIDGETLARRVARGPLAVPDVVEKAARALHVAHEAGLIHRDIKPGNILITAEGDPVICDFGLAREEHGQETLTKTGEARGTPAYMSPEQLRAARDEPLDRRTDVYSLGVVLYECLTGRCPVQATSWEALFREILTGTPPDPRGLSRDLKVVLATALEKDRNRRYATAQALADDLERVRERRPIAARPAGPWLRARRWAQRRPAAAVSLVLGLLILVGVPLLVAAQEHKALVRLRAEKKQVERQRDRAEQQHYVASIAAADASLKVHQVAEAKRRLDDCPEGTARLGVALPTPRDRLEPRRARARASHGCRRVRRRPARSHG